MIYSALTILFIFFFGAAIGSFIAASVYRMGNRISIVKGRSECIFCQYKLSFYDLIPIISFLFLRGKCRKCGAPISRGDFFVEIISGILFVLPILFYWNNLFALNSLVLIVRDWIFLSVLLFLFLYDLKYKILPDIVSIPATVIVFVINALLGYKILNLLLAMAIGAGFFLLQYFISRGKWVGDGDIRLGALLGVGLGFPGILLALLVAYVLGAFVSIALLLSKRVSLKTEIAFGTFLALGGATGIFFGDKIINWYLSIL